MDIFLSSTANFVNNIQQANHTPAPNTPSQPPQPAQNASIGFSGANTQKKRSIDSLGGGRVI
ncbi:hypothetical protein [Pseudomonas sp. Marseille-Q1929]|uniref:hypothetical protein n=1 Tax=Pseudomonas sp. Marseille-Q1929 TaxID=2730402 RepID=UPI001A8FE8C3|nr:hypothetical protein [Pseudomonas sp. Marseille-Q1929]MBO0493596.1 hypothetical protein [Pseudomonas sp. Marseille-Q1929]